MSDVAVGTKVFSRTDELAGLLRSISGSGVSTVYVADDGPNRETREDLYGFDWPFELRVIEMEYDAGLGAGRNRIVDLMDERFLLLVDPDHRVPGNVETLREMLIEDDGLGGVGGMLFEPDEDLLYCTGQNFKQTGRILVQSPFIGSKEIEILAGGPIVRFDLIPNAAMFRRKCLEEYCWDSEYVIGNEHTDFYLGHKRRTDWEFGVSFSVYFEHTSPSRMDPESTSDYDQHRYDRDKLRQSREYFLDKWDFDDTEVESWTWFVLDSSHIPEAVIGE